jgi:uncharacterized protein YndB with AHSA1/START domain
MSVKDDGREVVSARVFPFPREVVFGAVREPGVLARWWGPAGFVNVVRAFEYRPGGVWRVVMRGPDGVGYENVWEFVEIVEAERVVMRHLEPGHRFELTMTFEEAAVGGGTRVTWRMAFESAEEVARVGALVRAANEENFDRWANELA